MTTRFQSSAAPKVSVIIPCFNLGQYIDEAVDSVLGQTCQDFEIVIVNDGSTDVATNDRLRDYQRPRTRVLTTDNRGLAAARNLGISVARGSYLSALDADDKLEPTYIEKATRILDENADVSFVSSWLRTFGEEDWVWRQDRCDLQALLAECTVSTAALVRASALLSVGGYDEHMPLQGYEDWDLWITLVERGFQGVILPDVLFHYRRRSGSMSSTCSVGQGHLELMRYLVEKHRSSYEEHLFDILMHREAATGDLLRSNHALERDLYTRLIPAVDQRRLELERLRQKLRQAEADRHLRTGRDQMVTRIDELERTLIRDQAHLQELSTVLTTTMREVDALRTSKSWRVTAPLRAAQDLLTKLTTGQK